MITGVGERDVYRTPAGEFTWDYGANLLTRLFGDPPVRLPRAGDLLPPELARRVLTAAAGRPGHAPCPPAGWPGTTRPACGSPRPTRTPRSATSTSGPTRTPACRSPAELTARGADRPVLRQPVRRAGHRPAPGADVLVPRRSPASGFSLATAPDVGDVLGAPGPRPGPVCLAGRELRQADIGGVRGVGVYGAGLSAFVALPVPPRHRLGRGRGDHQGGRRQQGAGGRRGAGARPSRRCRWWWRVPSSPAAGTCSPGMTTTDVLRAAAGELTAAVPGAAR